MRRALLFAIIFFVCTVATTFAAVPGFMKAKMGTLAGKFYIDKDVPLTKGIVSLFSTKDGPPPIVGSSRRVPDMVTRTDGSGKFSVKLVPGAYYMGALVRDIKGGPGPPREGEDYFFAMTGQGELRQFKVKRRQLTEAGAIEGTTPDKFTEFKNFVIMAGRVFDEHGVPFKGAIVTVKEKLNAPRPKYVAKRVGADGKYELKLPAGRYYLMARESLRRGRPKAGSFVGAYGKTGPSNSGSPTRAGGVLKEKPDAGTALVIEAKVGEVYYNLDITMFAIPDPEKTRIQNEREARKRTDEHLN